MSVEAEIARNGNDCTLTCKSDDSIKITWFKGTVDIGNCGSVFGGCSPSNTTLYAMTENTTLTVKEFYLVIKNFESSQCDEFKCQDNAGSSKTTSVTHTGKIKSLTSIVCGCPVNFPGFDLVH